VRGTVSMLVLASPASSLPAMGSGHGAIPVHGTAHMDDPALPTMYSRCHSMADPVTHLVVVTRAEDHTHMMVTRWAAGVSLKPADRLNLSATTSPIISQVPTDYHSALANQHWCAAM
jgi:hypothetical protein